MTKQQELPQDSDFTFAVMAETIGQIQSQAKQKPEQEIEPTGDEILDWFFNTQHLNPPKLDHTRLSLFVRQERIEKDFKIVVEGQSALTPYIEAIDADLRVFELSNTRTGTFTQRDLVLAMTYGMMNVEEGLHALILHAVKEEDDSYPVPDFSTLEEGFHYLETHGNDRLAALIGSILAARMGRIPVLLTGEIALVAVRFLGNIDPNLISHCLYAGLVKCEEKELLGSLALLVLEAEEEQVIAGTALAMIQQWQRLFYGA